MATAQSALPSGAASGGPSGGPTDGVLRTNDGVPLKTTLRRVNRRQKIIAFGLVLPLFLFILITFLAPIGMMLFRAVDNPVLQEQIPRTVALLNETWDGEGLPDDAVYDTLAEEMIQQYKVREIAKVGTRLNYEQGGLRSLITSTARTIARRAEPPWKEAFIKIDERWGEPETWGIIQNAAPRYTLSFVLAALDLRYDWQGDIVSQPENEQIYVKMFVRTIWISGLVTVLCLALGFPVGYLLANLPMRQSNLLMILVLLPFWTSLLVRTTTWIVLLQTEGVLNDIMVWVGLISDDGRVQMIYNQLGTIIAMTHILLPFMVLPIFSVMKTISPSHMRAARSLGATPPRAFWDVYVPQTLPGIGAGSILVFILSVGYYITPALVGGRTGQLISNFIAYHMQKSLNWGLAAALGGLLLLGVLVLYWLYNRLVGIDKMKFG
ncbi:ABC transporter permease [Roseospira marina]|uniref:ABC transporter permease n=1 Tax=Roseospira marina TaxID=140057 RepID=A0A5M6IHE6_9PROT|nr:ABC transporter permease [Roseospira marina]KAA5607357.1 ABC transporter permease [Roseospira marina]MBB4312475.1 putative spermidine/putrescine transport system permease protein [Roseospira marina]MBB5085509.1 putative spermidine/putrescine transport system permease protein [Roseospira marina]